ncbi:folliculin-like isoform X2 [Sycon ciliatum]|uniref:folliculin-like isoform X2 n=1 Tax=Sycon ciliatum TaxID=27933 RepID=UPI0031F6B0E9
MVVIVALCHFCELSGPSIVFTTQTRQFGAVDNEAALRDQGYEVVERRQSSSNLAARVPGATAATAVSDVALAPASAGLTTPGMAMGRGGTRPSVEQATASTATPASVEKVDNEESHDTRLKQHCQACQSFSQQHHGFISTDPATNMHYLTSQEPYTAALYGTVRHACLRSLSSEGCPGREGPVLFGSDQQGYVFSFTFYLKDSEARGRTRLCSIVVCSEDKLLLSSSWLFLVECCGAISEEMKSKALSVFDRDQHDALKSSTLAHIHSANKGLRRPEQVRSIAELCKQPQLYLQLHQSFSWMLSGLFTRVQTVPMTCKKRELTKRESFNDSLDEDDDSHVADSVATATAMAPTETQGQAHDARDNGHHKTYTATDNAANEGPCFSANEGPCFSANEGPCFSANEGPCFSSLKHIHRRLGASNFHLVANHVIRGSQIIVRSDSPSTNISTLNILGNLLPTGCCSAVANSPQYLDSYRCNLLGMRLESDLPQHLSGSEVFVLLDIVSSSKIDDRIKKTNLAGWNGIACTTEGDPFQGYNFLLFCGGSGRDNPRNTGPLLLQRLNAIVADPCLDDGATSECLSALKEEWMSKVHIAYRFSRRASEDATANRPRLLQVLQVGPEELPVLQFWLRALDSEQRGVLLRL